jgi:N6-L-threonylcarbamoyladenine synthase
MNVLGIETSCDETAAAVVRDGREVLSNIVYSQVAQHRPYGGVVPEIAARQHVEHLAEVLERAVAEAGVGWGELDAVAATCGPGLATSLLVGLAAAKALAIRLDRPLFGVNHLEAHVYSVFLGAEASRPEALGPWLALVISGGHTCLVRADGVGRYRLLGRTLDDAAGEAFDKGATLLHLGYPGGPAIERAAAEGGDPAAVAFPRGYPRRLPLRLAGLDPGLCFSFSGLKTALLYYLRDHAPTAGQRPTPADLAASYQEAIVDTLVGRTDAALVGLGTLVVAGGVALNRRLRARLTALAARTGIRLLLAAPVYCTDNAAMVAGLAGWQAMAGRLPSSVADLDASPNLGIGEAE